MATVHTNRRRTCAGSVMTAGILSNRVSCTGRGLFRGPSAAGRGVIALTGHLGNFLIMNSRLALEGYSVDLLVKGMRDPRVEDRMDENRSGRLAIRAQYSSKGGSTSRLVRDHEVRT